MATRNIPPRKKKDEAQRRHRAHHPGLRRPLFRGLLLRLPRSRRSVPPRPGVDVIFLVVVLAVVIHNKVAVFRFLRLLIKSPNQRQQQPVEWSEPARVGSANGPVASSASPSFLVSAAVFPAACSPRWLPPSSRRFYPGAARTPSSSGFQWLSPAACLSEVLMSLEFFWAWLSLHDYTRLKGSGCAKEVSRQE